MRKVLFAALLPVLFWPVPPAEAQVREQAIAIIEERAEARGVSAALLTRIVRCESQLGTQVVGDGGHSHGPVQLSDLPTGLLRHFLSVGYDDAYSMWQSVDYLARVAAGTWSREGITLRRWSCY